MKSRCSFILKAGLALVLCFILLFGTMSTGMAALVKDISSTGAIVDLAETGWNIVYLTGEPVGDWDKHGEYYFSGGDSSGQGTMAVYIEKDQYFTVYVGNTRANPYESTATVSHNSGYGVSTNNSSNGNSLKFNDTSGLYIMHKDQTGNNNGNDQHPHIWPMRAGTPRVVGSVELGICDGTAWSYNKSENMTLDKSSWPAKYTYTSYVPSTFVKADDTNYEFKIADDASYSNAWPSSNYNLTDKITPNAKISYTFEPAKNLGTVTAVVEHKVTCTYDSNGGLSSDVSYVANGSKVKFTFSPNDGYEVATFTVNGTSHKSEIENNEYEFTLSSESAVSASVTYQLKTYNISYNPGTNGTGMVASTSKTHFTNATLSSSTFSRTGYNQTGWATEDGGTKAYDLGGTYTTEADTTLYPFWTAKTTTVTLDKNHSDDNSVSPWTQGSASVTATYDAAMPAATMPTRTGYTFDGYFDDPDSGEGTQYYVANGSSAKTWDAEDGTKTLYAHWSLITGGAVAKAYTSGSASSAGGTVQIGSGTPGASVELSAISYVGNNSVVATAATGFTLTGWTFNGDNVTHLKYSFDNSTYTAVSTNPTTVAASGNTIYIMTDGASGITTENAEIRANFTAKTYTLSYEAIAMDDLASGYTVTTITDPTGAEANNNGISGTADYGDVNTLTPASVGNYTFVGWVVVNDSSSAVASSFAADQTMTSVESSYAVTLDSIDNAYYHFYALYAKNYTVSAFKTYDEEAGTFSEYTTPPRSIALTHVNGSTDTYTYDASLDGTYNTTSDIVEGTVSETRYGNGAAITALAGDRVVLTYSAMPSSDAIKGVFYNNTATYYAPPTNNAEYTALNYTYGGNAGALYVDASLYPGQSAVTIATVNQNNRTVSFTVKNMDYKNITIEHTGKCRFIFKSTTGANVLSESVNNYYLAGAEVGALDSGNATFGVKAATSSKATYTLTPSAVKFYTDFACTTEYSGASSITVAESADSNGYHAIRCSSMPAFDIYIKLNITTSYTTYLSSRMVSDITKRYTAWAAVADVKLDSTSNTQIGKTGGTSSTDGTYASAGDDETDSTYYTHVTKAAGSEVTLKWNWTDAAVTAGDNSAYTFLGWFKGDATGPDYVNGKLDLSMVANTDCVFTPTSNTYIYAVGTRNLYINGSKYITGAEEDWNSDGSGWVNFPMEFDASYINPDGGAAGRYYWTITEAMLTRAAGSNASYDGYYRPAEAITSYHHNSWGDGDRNAFWNNPSDLGNSYFQILDSATGTSRNYWKSITDFSNFSNIDIAFEKRYSTADSSSLETAREQGLGFIIFNSTQTASQFANYKAPITIYAYPGKGFSVASTPQHASAYVSDGFEVSKVTTSSGTYNTSTIVSIDDGGVMNNVDSTSKLTRSGDGWDPSVEDHISHIRMTTDTATLQLSKTVADGYKVSAFIVYNLSDDSVVPLTATKAETPDSTVYKSTGTSHAYESFGAPTGTVNTYTATLEMSDASGDVYVVPVIEEEAATMTIEFDASDMSTEKWGDLVSCYAWYTSATNGDAYGAFPGQLMIPNNETKVWTAKIAPTRTIDDTEYTLAGVLFANYYESGATWVSDNAVYSANIISVYNNINSGTKYARSNFKAQTYDYHEPVAMYENAEDKSATTISFALKEGNSSDVLSLRHSELISSGVSSNPTIFTGINHTDSSEGNSTITLNPSTNFEYLTDSSGKYCVDLNGTRLVGSPTPSYYIIAKGMATYVDSAMTKVYYSANHYDSTSSITYGTSLNLSNAVQWYIYDTNGTYITTIMSSGFADAAGAGSSMRTKVAQAILDANAGDPSGKSAMICYDVPRYCYASDAENADFNAYRFSGQWYSTTDVDTLTVDVKVGCMLAGGEFVLSEDSSESYGSATATYKISKTPSGTYWSYVDPGTELPSDAITLAKNDAAASPLLLSAVDKDSVSSGKLGDFVGWYTYNENQNTITPVSESQDGYYPSFSKDTTYYAMYNIILTYNYGYSGREGDSYSYTSTDDTGITAAELEAGAINLSNPTRASAVLSNYANVKGVFSVFHKDITVNPTSGTVDGYSATFNCASTALTGSLTVYSSSEATPVTQDDISYGTVVNFSNPESPFYSIYTAVDAAGFSGWYQYDASTDAIGDLVSSNPLFGLTYTYTDNLTVIAQSGTNYAFSEDADWKSYVSENVLSTEGSYRYNDFAIGYLNREKGTDVLPITSNEGYKFGVLMIMTDKADTSDAVVALNNIKSGTTGSENTNKYTATAQGYITGALNKNVKLGGLSGDDYTTRLVVISGTTISSYNRVDIALKTAVSAYKGYSYYAVSFMYDGTNYYFSNNIEGLYS